MALDRVARNKAAGKKRIREGRKEGRKRKAKEHERKRNANVNGHEKTSI